MVQSFSNSVVYPSCQVPVLSGFLSLQQQSRLGAECCCVLRQIYASHQFCEFICIVVQVTDVQDLPVNHWAVLTCVETFISFFWASGKH